MNRSFLAALVVLSFSLNLNAMWEMISTEQLVAKTDLIVVGTLHDVKEFTKDGIDYSEGIILVEKVIAGKDRTSSGEPLKFGDKIVIKWQNSSMIVCPRVEHKADENVKGIWLLEVESSGGVKSDYPWRFMPLDELDRLRTVLKKTKVRRNLTKISIVEKVPLGRIEALSSTVEHTTSEKLDESRSESSTQEYSLINAISVFLFSLGLYWLLYRNRFRIR